MNHRLAHLQNTKVKKGDRVKKGQLIGHLGDTGKTKGAHVHYDILTYTPKSYKEYTSGKSRSWVKEHYADPTPHEKVVLPNLHHYGWKWLEHTGELWHPGVDLNGPGAGDSDKWSPVYSPVNGKVVYSYGKGSYNGGWGNMIVIEEDLEEESCELIKAELSHLKAKDKMMEDRLEVLIKERKKKEEKNEALKKENERMESELELQRELVKKLKSNKSELRKRAESGAIVGSITVIVGYIVIQYDLPEEVRTAIIGLAVGIVTQITKYLHNLKKRII
jgi:hypothetical protein